MAAKITLALKIKFSFLPIKAHYEIGEGQNLGVICMREGTLYRNIQQ